MTDDRQRQSQSHRRSRTAAYQQQTCGNLQHDDWKPLLLLLYKRRIPGVPEQSPEVDTLQSTIAVCDLTPSTMNVCVRPDKYDLNQFRAEPPTANQSRRTVSRLSWSTVSNAKLKSSNTNAVTLPSSTARITSFIRLTTAVSVLWWYLYADCRAGKDSWVLHVPHTAWWQPAPQVLKQSWGSISVYIRVHVGFIKCRFLQPG